MLVGIIRILAGIYNHVVTQLKGTTTSVTVLAANGRAVLLAGILASPCYHLTTEDIDFCTLGIFATADACTPTRAVGKHIATIDK